LAAAGIFVFVSREFFLPQIFLTRHSFPLECQTDAVETKGNFGGDAFDETRLRELCVIAAGS
jgi:hypothetical protein